MVYVLWPYMAGGTKVRVVLNPSAGAGAAMRRLPRLSESLRRHGLKHDILLTKRPGHAAELAREARAEGVEVIAVMGGDGTLNEVAQAYVDAAGEVVAGPDLAVIPSGTGGDFRKTLGLTGALDEAVGRIRFGARRPVDLGVLRLVGNGGEDLVRAFVNVASFGIGGHVDALVNDTPKWLGGRASFLLATVRAMARYHNAPVRVTVDGARLYEGPAFNVAIANGRYFGGGMMIAPHADPGDGRFEVVVLGDLTRPEAVALAPRVYEGAHLGKRGVAVGAGVRVEAEPLQPWGQVLVDVDGEAPGRLPLRAQVARAALAFRA